MSEIRIQKTGEPDVIEASDGRLATPYTRSLTPSRSTSSTPAL